MRSMLVLFALCCSGANLPDYPVKPADQYKNVVEKSGLLVAVVALEDRKEQHTYFGADLQQRGYVPVFLVIENRSGTDSLLFERDGLMYGSVGASTSAVPDASKASKTEKILQGVAYVPTVYTFMATIFAAKAKDLRQNLLRKELQSATLSPRASVHGFIFIPARQRTASNELHVPFTRSGTNDVLVIDCVF